MNIGLIGYGFVGEAIYENLKHDYNFLIYDKKPARSSSSALSRVVAGANIIFVALPTPMNYDGGCDLSIIFEVMQEIYQHYNNNIIIIFGFT